MRALTLALAACSPWHQEASRATVAPAFDRAGLRAGELAVSHQINGIALTLDAQGQRYERDEPTSDPAYNLHRRASGGGIDLGMRVSALGLFAEDDRFTRWFDVGVAGAAGGGLMYPSRLTTYGQVWGGGWLSFGLPSVGGDDIYPALIFDLRRVAPSEWDNRTVFTVGLAVTRRFAAESLFARPTRIPVR